MLAVWEYEIASGAFFERSETGTMVLLAHGYSGFGIMKNDPKAVGVQYSGPIPPGEWIVCQAHYNLKLGPLTMLLWPYLGTPTLGRSGFAIHGDSIRNPGQASHGCIILPHAVRAAIANRVATSDVPLGLTVR